MILIAKKLKARCTNYRIKTEFDRINAITNSRFLSSIKTFRYILLFMLGVM